MLVICNGAFKSGSTWVYELVNSILKVKRIELSPIDKRYSPNRSPAMKIAEDKIHSFVGDEDLSNWYLTKAHFFTVKALSANYGEGVKFLFVERDLRDAVVSHYHHFLIYNKIKLSFDNYYRLIGRYKAYEIWLFNNRCRAYFGDKYFFNFEAMKKEVDTTIDRICYILNLDPLTPGEREVVLEETSLDSLRNRAKSGDNTHYHGAGKNNVKLFRKGKTGEYERYFNKRNLRDIEKVMDGKFTVLSRFVYDLMFTYRRKLF